MNAHETPIMTLLRDAPDQSTIRRALALTSPEELESLYAAAYEVKTQQVGRTVYFRGIIEMSNICRKDCLYCGIRSSNRSVRRFTMSEDEVLNAAHWAMEAQYGSIVIQTGEWTSPAFAETIEQIIRRIKEESNGTLGITLSLGEQSPETYKRWFKAGAHRYLLRIETSNPELYARIHPPDHLFDARVECLSALREIGYQVGTGVMIGVPGQTLDDLAGDVQFFMDLDVDMIGMGPYIPHADTPMGASSDGFDPEEQLTLGLKMIAVCRIAMSKHHHAQSYRYSLPRRLSTVRQ
jgi:biotin synthase